MKKTYINPDIKVVTMKSMVLLAGSDKSTPLSEKSASEWGSRDFDIEFDEDEDY